MDNTLGLVPMLVHASTEVAHTQYTPVPMLTRVCVHWGCSRMPQNSSLGIIAFNNHDVGHMG